MNTVGEKNSLNKEYRKKELLKITLENYELLKRLNSKTSTYNVNKWEEDFKYKERMMRSMSEFPEFYDERQHTIAIKEMLLLKKQKRSTERLPEINLIKNNNI